MAEALDPVLPGRIEALANKAGLRIARLEVGLSMMLERMGG